VTVLLLGNGKIYGKNSWLGLAGECSEELVVIYVVISPATGDCDSLVWRAVQMISNWACFVLASIVIFDQYCCRQEMYQG
jgi:hypothetical protein